MKEKCDIVQDLLPIYLDGELKESTKRFVEEHLRECPKCNKLLDASFEGEQLFRTAVQDNRLDAISGRRMWYKAMVKYLLKPAFWVLLTLFITTIAFVTFMKRPDMLGYEILTTVSTAEEMLNPGYFRSNVSKEGSNALSFYLERFSSPSDTHRQTYHYRASIVKDTVIVDRLYSSIGSPAEIYYPDVSIPEPAFLDPEELNEIIKPAQFALSFNRLLSLEELEILFDGGDFEILWLGIATREVSDAPKGRNLWDDWGLPIYYMHNSIQDLGSAVEDELRRRSVLLTDYMKYLTGIDPYIDLRLDYLQKEGIRIYGVIVRGMGPELNNWLKEYPLVRYFRRLS